MSARHILIVDDEPKVGYFLGKSLELSKRECRVSTARTGEEALEILERNHIDLLITDLRMPGVSGLELIRWVKTTSPSTRAILITAYGNDQIRDEARRLEVYHYLTKPFNVKDFTKVVDGALQSLDVSTPEFTIISDATFEVLTERLDRLCDETGARCAFLADMQGQRIAEVGPVAGLDTTMLLTLLAGGFATSAELTRRFNRGHAANLFFQEGEDFDICSSNVGENLIVAMLFDRNAQKGRLGMVWLYTRRAIDDLLGMLSKANATSPEPVLEDDFGTSLMAELETAFDDASTDSIPTPKHDSTKQATRGSLESAGPSPRVGHPPASTGQPPVSTGQLPAPTGPGLLTLEEAIGRGLLPPGFQTLGQHQHEGQS